MLFIVARNDNRYFHEVFLTIASKDNPGNGTNESIRLIKGINLSKTLMFLLPRVSLFSIILCPIHPNVPILLNEFISSTFNPVPADLYSVERIHYYDNSYNMAYIPKRFESILCPLIHDSQAPAMRTG